MEDSIRWPPCPQREHFPLITGFITPASDLPCSGGLDGSISLDVTDPSENNERIRVVETDTAWDLNVKWCVCGPFASWLRGCWCVQVFIDDIDGVGPTHGLLGSAKVDASSPTEIITSPSDDDTSKRCFKYKFNFRAGRVRPGVYDLVVVITLSLNSCDRSPSRLASDTLGYAVIPVLVFYDENARFCPPPEG